ncbi:MAG: 6-phosphofructokinase [Alphaproteobacteria bacterium]|nr:6-phosphofructokinase [Alphaproteobacteria bacterium]
MRIGVLTSGGDSPGMNAAIRSVVKASIARGHAVVGIRNGYEGLLAADMVELQLNDVDGISRFGGTMLGSARSLYFPTPEGQADARRRVKEAGLDGLVVIGGNGSLAGAHALSDGRPCQVVGLPASIDNDIGHSRLCIGVDTAVNTIVEACDRISDTARAHRRAFVVEVMGRHSGYLAMRAGIAADADAILYAEEGLDEETLVQRLRKLLQQSFSDARDKKRVLIVKAEGVTVPTARIVERLAKFLETDAPGVGIRETILGHVVRGGSPSAMDRLIAQRLALGAVLGLEAGVHDAMLAWEPSEGVGAATRDPSVAIVPLAEVLAETQRMLDGTSASTKARVALLQAYGSLLAL